MPTNNTFNTDNQEIATMQPQPTKTNIIERNTVLASILAFFFGPIGGQDFYLDRKGIGLIKIILFSLTIFLGNFFGMIFSLPFGSILDIWTITDMILITKGKIKTPSYVVLKKSTSVPLALTIIKVGVITLLTFIQVANVFYG